MTLSARDATLTAPGLMPRPPVYATVADERVARKRTAVAAMRLFARLGYDEPIAGHFAVRDPERTDCLWVNPVMADLASIQLADLVLMDESGQVIAGRHPPSIGAFVLHSQVHARRPEVVASAHFHSKYGRAWASLGRPLAPISQDSCAFYGCHSVFADYFGVPQTLEEGARLAEGLGQNFGMIMQNHGLLTVGRSVEEAAWRYVMMERACETQFLAESIGSPRVIDSQVAARTADYIGSEYSAWLSFLPMYDYITRLEPDIEQEADDGRLRTAA